MSSARNLKLINLFALFANAWFFIPTLLPFCKDNLHAGYQGMLMSEAIFAASIVVFDVPTGWISDVWRRKNALALGAAANFVGVGVLLFATNIWHLFLSQLIMGIGISLFNGTHTALLYDTLLSLGREDEYRQREGKRQALGLYGIAAAGTIGALVYPHNHFMPILLCMAAHGIVFTLCCFMIEPERHKPAEKKHPINDIVETFKYVVHGHEDAGLVILLASILFCGTKCIMWAQQPYYMAMHIPETYYGALMSLGWLLGGFSSHAAHLFDGKLNNFRMLVLALGIAVLFCLGAAVYLSFSGVALLIIGGSCIYGSASPRVYEIINRRVDSSKRATLLSTLTFLSSLLFIPVSSMVGWLADAHNIQIALTSIAAWILLSMLGLFLWKRSRALTVLR